MSSLEYAELHGLKIALSNLQALVDTVDQDEEWISVTEWMKNRIKMLSNK